jgi:hypothetical protein
MSERTSRARQSENVGEKRNLDRAESDARVLGSDKRAVPGAASTVGLVVGDLDGEALVVSDSRERELLNGQLRPNGSWMQRKKVAA